VLLAWNASREARRAISDALPILIAAQSVAVVVVDLAEIVSHGEEPGADIAHFLSRHGVIAYVEQLSSSEASVAETIFNFATRDKVDLSVLGAYSHSQTREMLFGGVTRSLLNSVTISTLIAH
jgi:nucleotide-binding universal stress UspA family protein